MNRQTRTFLVGVFQIAFFGLSAAISIDKFLEEYSLPWYKYVFFALYVYYFAMGIDRIRKTID